VLSPLAMLAEELGVTFIVVRHLIKGTATRALHRGGGSIGIIGAARAGFLVARDPDDDTRRIFACDKFTLDQEPASLAYRLVKEPGQRMARVKWEGRVELRADDLGGAPRSREERSRHDDAVEFLRTMLSDGEQLQREVLEQAKVQGLSERTLMRGKRSLVVIVDKTGYQGPWVWRLPKGAKDSKGGQDSPRTKVGPLWSGLAPFEESGPRSPRRGTCTPSPTVVESGPART
jgi:hypothetical protein